MDDVVLINEVLELTLAYQRGDATAEERARLERLLSDNPRAIDWYLRIVDDTLTLRSGAAVRSAGAAEEVERGSAGVGAAERPGVADRGAGSGVTLPHPVVRVWRSWFALAAAACLLVVVASLPGWWLLRESGADAAQYDNGRAVRVVSISNVRWAEGAKHYREWSFIQPGESLKIETGLVNLFLSDGAELLVAGPADVKIESPQKVIAYQGKLAARVGPGAVGFRIETPHAEVIDRGTAFGISVGERTDVVVYDGIVDLDVLGDRSLPRRRLATGEALSVSRLGQLSRITTVQSAEFLEPPQVRVPGAVQDRVITAVNDNVRSLETTKYYRIIPRGFREDCRAYVDRQHEWNGLDERGLPPFLLGGDYVMTFNDDKIVTEIEMAITLSQPATLYVIVDDRVTPPEWLTRDFVNTQWDVGSDEGYDDHEIAAGVGAGLSLDRICSVWRREVPEPTTVMLGALSHEKSTKTAREVERSMYGIVATPLYRERSRPSE